LRLFGDEIMVIDTLQTPVHPIAMAAALLRSIDLPLMKGPRSLMRTCTVRPL